MSIENSSGTIKILLDSDSNYIENSASDLLSDGYVFSEDDCTDLENISFYGRDSAKIFKPTFTFGFEHIDDIYSKFWL